MATSRSVQLPVIRGDLAGAADREHAAEAQVRQRDLRGAACERELDAQAAGGAVRREPGR